MIQFSIKFIGSITRMFKTQGISKDGGMTGSVVKITNFMTVLLRNVIQTVNTLVVMKSWKLAEIRANTVCAIIAVTSGRR